MGVVLFQQGEAMLDGDEHGFKYAQAQDASEEGEGNPQRGMHPQSGLIINLDKGDEGDDQKPHNHEGKKGRSIRRIMVFQHKPALAAGIDNA
jgi:hypothetical protein